MSNQHTGSWVGSHSYVLECYSIVNKSDTATRVYQSVQKQAMHNVGM